MNEKQDITIEAQETDLKELEWLNNSIKRKQ